MNSYTLKHLSREFSLSDEMAEIVAEISPALREQLQHDLTRAFDEHVMNLCSAAPTPPKPEPLDIEAMLQVCRKANRRRAIQNIFDRAIAHALTLGYMDGLAGANRACPFCFGRFADIWLEGQQQGREHRARTHEGSTSILTKESIEAALIRLGQL